MIISNVIGGLGNQMFQFAAGRALALERGVELKLDVSGFEGYELHQGFQLQQAFQGAFSAASQSEVGAMLGWQRGPLAQRLLSRPAMAGVRRACLVVEPHFQYWNGLRSVPTPCYLKGYWQSERYFQAHAATLQADFSFRSALEGNNLALAERMRQQNAISLHVRRGDYVSNQRAATLHGACSPDFYRAAVQHMLDRVHSPVFYVFSDDMPWVKQHLQLSVPTHHVEHNSLAFDDMQLMSLCKHHIIANSSFSWWGAWLNPSPSKIVLAPKQWFAQPRCLDDLLPAAWVTL